ncbi:hypothetical protein D3C77_701560 [compost metagenome]
MAEGSTPALTGYSAFTSAYMCWAVSPERNSISFWAASLFLAYLVMATPLTLTWAPRSPWFGKLM